MAAMGRIARRGHAPEGGGTAPRLPPLLVTGAQGTGKTTTVLKALESHLRRMSIPFVAWVLVPTVAKAAEEQQEFMAIAARRGRYTPNALVLRGRSAPVPGAAGFEAPKMCARADLAEEVARRGLPVGRVLCRREPQGGGDEASALCPFFAGCPYEDQADRLRRMERGIVFLSHAYAVTGAPGPRPDVIVIDESIVNLATWVAWEEAEAVAEGPDDADVPVAVYREVGPLIAAAFRHPANLRRLRHLVSREELEAARHELRQATRPLRAELRPDMADAELGRALQALPRDRSATLARLLDALLAEFDSDGDVFRRVWSDIKPAGRGGPRRRIFFGGLQDLKLHPDANLLLLDGTGDVDLNRRLFGDDLVHEHVPVPRDARVIQCRTRLFSRQSLTGCDSFGQPMSARKREEAARLREEVRALSRHLPGPVFIATYKRVADLLREEGLPEDVHVGHFGALRGMNTWKDCRTVILLGREQPSHHAMEAAVRPWLRADEPPLVTGGYREEVRYVRLRDGGVQAMMVEVHPDPRVQRYLEQVREAELVQAIDRVRAIFNPRTIVILTKVVLDVTVDVLATWETLSRDVPAFRDLWERTGVLPTAPKDLFTARPEVFRSADAARKAMARVRALQPGVHADAPPMDLLLGDSPSNTSVRYRHHGARGANAWSTAYVAPRHHDPLAALVALVGPVAEAEVLSHVSHEAAPACAAE